MIDSLAADGEQKAQPTCYCDMSAFVYACRCSSSMVERSRVQDMHCYLAVTAKKPKRKVIVSCEFGYRESNPALPGESGRC